MKTRPYLFLAAAVTALLSTTLLAQTETDAPMSFFVTSEAHSGDLGGLAGADASCQRLARAAGSGDRTWRAYLSA